MRMHAPASMQNPEEITHVCASMREPAHAPYDALTVSWLVTCNCRRSPCLLALALLLARTILDLAGAIYLKIIANKRLLRDLPGQALLLLTAAPGYWWLLVATGGPGAVQPPRCPRRRHYNA